MNPNGYRTAYLDESLTKGHLFIGAILPSPSASKRISQNLRQILAEVQNNDFFDLSGLSEFKASEIWNGKNSWQNVGERFRYSVLINLIENICNEDIEIAIQGLDRFSHDAKYRYPDHPYFLSLKYLLEQIDRRMEQQNNLALIVIDNQGSNRDQSALRKEFKKYKTLGTGGNYPRKLDWITDSLHFVPSHESFLIQSADLITYIFRKVTVNYPISSTEKTLIDYFGNSSKRNHSPLV